MHRLHNILTYFIKRSQRYIRMGNLKQTSYVCERHLQYICINSCQNQIRQFIKIYQAHMYMWDNWHIWQTDRTCGVWHVASAAVNTPCIYFSRHPSFSSMRWRLHDLSFHSNEDLYCYYLTLDTVAHSMWVPRLQLKPQSWRQCIPPTRCIIVSWHCTSLHQ